MEANHDKKYHQRFNEHVYIMRLNNGMEVHLLPKDDPYYTTYVELSYHTVLYHWIMFMMGNYIKLLQEQHTLWSTKSLRCLMEMHF